MKRIDIVAIIGILVAVGVFFWPVWQGKLPVPTDTLVGLYHPWRDLYAHDYPRGIPFKNSLITDPIRQQIPWRKIAIDQWKSGQIPSWNPFNFSGTSLAGNIQAAVFYPLNVLFFLFDFDIAWTLLIILQPILSGTFIYLYLKSRNLSVISCLFGALTWSYSGFSIAWLTWGTMIHVVLWLPLILLSIDKLKEKRLTWSIVLVISLTMQTLAGHVQLSLYVFVLSVIYALWRREKYFWIPFVMSLSITSIQWIPFMQSVLASSRVATTNWQITGWFLPWQHLAQFIAPDYFGNPATGNYWGVWNYGEFIGYVGIIGLLFAVCATFYARKSADVKFWGIVGTTALIFLLPTPLAIVPFLLNLPILSTLQPTRLMAIVDFSLVALAAYGFDHWLKKPKQFWTPLVVIGGGLGILWVFAVILSLDVSVRNLILPSAIFVAAAFIFLTKSTRFGSVVLVAILVFDLLRFGWKFTPFVESKYFFPKTSTIEFLEKQEKPFRVLSVDPKVFPPNSAAFYGIEDVGGYDPIISVRYEAYMAALARGKADISPPFGFNRIVGVETVASPLVRLLNVRFVLTLSDLSDPQYVKVYQEGQTRVYEYKDWQPRAYLVSDIVQTKDDQETIDIAYNPTFNSQTSAVVNTALTIDESPLLSGETVHFTKYEYNRMELSVTTAKTRLLVVANRYDQGWRVFLDGQQSPIVRVNFLFFGIIVPAGQHSINVEYRII